MVQIGRQKLSIFPIFIVKSRTTVAYLHRPLKHVERTVAISRTATAKLNRYRIVILVTLREFKDVCSKTMMLMTFSEAFRDFGAVLMRHIGHQHLESVINALTLVPTQTVYMGVTH